MPPAGFEPGFPESERPQTHSLDGATTGIGNEFSYLCQIHSRKRRLLILRHNFVVVLNWWTPNGRSRWPRDLRCSTVATRLLGLQVRIPPRKRISLSCQSCVLSGRRLCDGPIHRQESYGVLCVCGDFEAPPNRRRRRELRHTKSMQANLPWEVSRFSDTQEFP